MSNIFHKIEHGIEHTAKDVGSAVEGITTQKIAETIVETLTSPEAIETEEIALELV